MKHLLFKAITSRLFICLTASILMLCGCSLFTPDIKDKIVELLEEKGAPAAIEYIDSLVEDGRLGAKNAEDIKAAIPLGVEKVKEKLQEVDND